VNSIFITGTDTDVGKTLITGLLARAFCEMGRSVITQKWVQTGCRTFNDTDIAVHLSLMNREVDEIKPFLPDVIPYRFKFPASPHLAARREKKRIDLRKIEQSHHALCQKFELVLAEGAGGLMVPVTPRVLFIDLVQKLRLPILLIVHNKLGCVNQALLNIEAIRRRKLNLLGLIFNNAENQNAEILKDNVRIVASISGETILGVVPRSKNKNMLYRTLKPIAGTILNRINHE
jgi:dethiobiotin synthetase